MPRRLFCEISPLTYKISRVKSCTQKRIKWMLSRQKFASTFSKEPLPVQIYSHKSLIRRTLGNVDAELQNNKAVNLGLAAPKVNGILIRPGETFSFWKLVGSCTKAKGYLDGLTISRNGLGRGLGGGMCQFTNLIHWMILHTPLEIIEHHHHNGVDMFPDFNRQIPFGTGTSIMYNHLDYEFVNKTDNTFQLIVYTNETHLCGEIRAEKRISQTYHVYENEIYFSLENGDYYRNNKVCRKVCDKITGNTIEDKLIIQNHSKVLYDRSFIDPELIRVPIAV